MAIGRTEKNSVQRSAYSVQERMGEGVHLSSPGLTRGSQHGWQTGIEKKNGSPIEAFGDDRQTASSFTLADARLHKGQDATVLKTQAKKNAGLSSRSGGGKPFVEIKGKRYTRSDIDEIVYSSDSRASHKIWWFSGGSLRLLIENNLFTIDHCNKIASDLESGVYLDRDNAIRFFKNNIRLLTTYDLFTAYHCGKVIADIDFFGAYDCQFISDNLLLLIKRNIFTADHCAKIISYFKNDDSPGRRFAYEFFRDNLHLLIENNIFTADHCGQIVACFENDNDGVYSSLQDFFDSNLSLLIKEKLFTADHCSKMVEWLKSKNTGNYFAVRQFFDKHLRLLINEKIFTVDHYVKMVGQLESPHWEHLLTTTDFFKVHLPTLIENKFFTADHFGKIVANLENGDLGISRSALDFIRARLPLLLENNLFTADHFSKIAVGLESEDINVYSSAHKFVEEHLPLLIERGFLRRVDVANMVLVSETLEKYFHILKSAGLLGRETLEEILERTHCPKDLIAPLLDIITVDSGWMNSPVRWRDLITIVVADPLEYDVFAHRKDVFYKILKRSALKGGGRLSLADVTSFLSFLKLAEETELAQVLRLFKEHARRIELKRTLTQTAERLEVINDVRYMAAVTKVNGEGGARLLADWALTGMDRVWEGYKHTGVEANDKRTKKLFLNFLEREAKREFPSLIHLATKRGWQAVEEGFEKRLVKGALPDEEERFKLFFRRPEWMKLKSTPLYWMLISASRFMGHQGMASMRRLILGLKIENKELVYPRYEELKGVVSDEFLAKWRAEYSEKIEGLGVLDEAGGRRVMRDQVLAQVGGHMGVKEGIELSKIPEAIRNLPARVAKWHAEFGASDSVNGEFLREAGELRKIFESHYGAIREHYGDVFAGIRTDFKNYIDGMEKGVRVARRSEEFEVSGKIEKIARSGSEPVTTCQTFEFAWVNQDGQPVNRMIHGQFKLANWIMDGTVVARRLLEVTVDDEGKMHLLVERLYSAGGFGRVREFHEEILKYAGSIGIDEVRVHFADAASAKTAPKPMRTGSLIYRDTFRVEGKTHEEIRKIRRDTGHGTRDTEFGTGDRGLGTAGIGVPDPESRVPSSVSAVDLSEDPALKAAVIPDGQILIPSRAVLNQRRQGARTTSDPSTGSGRSARRMTGVNVPAVRPPIFFSTP